MDIQGFAVWGFLGSVVYAAPRALASLSEGKASAHKPIVAMIELGLALGVGTIGGEAFTQFVADTLRQTSPADVRAIAVVLGMVSNQIAPGIINLLGEGFLRHFGAPIKRNGLPK